MLDVVGNPEERLSRVEALILLGVDSEHFIVTSAVQV